VPLAQSEAVIFAVNFRPARGARGHDRLAMRHGVSRLRAGSRCTLGVISTTPPSFPRLEILPVGCS
jgi:uncharacterized protein